MGKYKLKKHFSSVHENLPSPELNANKKETQYPCNICDKNALVGEMQHLWYQLHKKNPI